MACVLLLAEMRSVFDLFDINHDGTICVSELMKLMQSCGQNPTEGDVVEIMKAVDKNGKLGTNCPFCWKRL